MSVANIILEVTKLNFATELIITKVLTVYLRIKGKFLKKLLKNTFAQMTMHCRKNEVFYGGFL